MGRLYIASSLHNSARVVRLRDHFHTLGHQLTYDWTDHGYVHDQTELAHVAYREVAGVVHAQCVLMVLPARLGSHFEAGVAFALRIPIVLLDDLPADHAALVSFHQRPELIKCITEDAAVRTVLNILDGTHATIQHMMDTL